MLIAIDYDDTFSKNPSLFRNLIYFFKSQGCQCIIVTGRSNQSPWSDEVKRSICNLVPIVFAGKLWKKTAAKLAGYKVDVWIDDQPEYINSQEIEKTIYKTHELEWQTRFQVLGASITIESNEDLEDFFPCHACTVKWQQGDKVTFVRDHEQNVTHTIHDCCWDKFLVKMILL